MSKAPSSLSVRFVLQHTHVLLSRPGSVLGGRLLSLQQLGLSAIFRSSTWTSHCQDCPSLRSGRDPLLKRLFSVSELIPNRSLSLPQFPQLCDFAGYLASHLTLLISFPLPKIPVFQTEKNLMQRPFLLFLLHSWHIYLPPAPSPGQCPCDCTHCASPPYLSDSLPEGWLLAHFTERETEARSQASCTGSLGGKGGAGSRDCIS